MTQFKAFCKQAFTKRAPRIFKTFTAISGKGIYKSKTIESALQSAFDKNSLLYGRALQKSTTPIRVAVTTTLAEEDRAAILSNYNTECRSEKLPYVFIRPQDPSQEFKVWEAARATSAAPPYFKPFIQDNTKRAYTDGAIHHHCPVFIADQERRLLWQDVKDWPPDIFLSIGSGFKIAEETLSESETMDLSPSDNFFKRTRKSRRATAGFKYFLRTANKIIENHMDCEKIWKNYYSQNKSAGDRMTYGDENRNIRLNVQFTNELPALDDVKSMDDMEHFAKLMFQMNQREIRKVAEKLIASCFYFETVGLAFRNIETGRFQCTGKIHCRFHDARDLQGLGKILLRYCSQKFVPSFLIKENYGSRLQKYYKESLSITAIKHMANQGIFVPPQEICIESIDLASQTNICLCLHSDRDGASQELFTTPLEISGFPRNLCAHGAFDVSSPEDDIKNSEKEEATESVSRLSEDVGFESDEQLMKVHASENTGIMRRVSTDSEPASRRKKLHVPWIARRSRSLIYSNRTTSKLQFSDDGTTSNSTLTIGVETSSCSVERSELGTDSWVAENSQAGRSS
ncbi:acyl transferase/acyl hydrolase/lysophospholipase [Trichoderma sp. TUCIM 5745]